MWHPTCSDRPPFGHGGVACCACTSGAGGAALGPVINPIAHAFANWRCTLCGWMPLVRCVWAYALTPPPAARSLGKQSGSAAHNPCCRAGWHLELAPWLACTSKQSAPWGGQRMPAGGNPLPLVRGVYRLALSLPRLPVLWRAVGVRWRCSSGGGLAGAVAHHRPHSAGHCELALHAAWVPGGCLLGRECLVPLRGASGASPSPSSGCATLGQAVGARCRKAVGAGVLAPGPGTDPFACMPFDAYRSALGQEVSRGGLLLPC